MTQESRIKRWRTNKCEQGLKHVSVWMPPEVEMRLKDLAIQAHCSTGYSGTTACEQESQRPESFAGVTEPSCGSTPGQASSDNVSAGVATPSARATVGAGDATSWAMLPGRPGTGVAMNP
jgi:hypothetical protein